MHNKCDLRLNLDESIALLSAIGKPEYKSPLAKAREKLLTAIDRARNQGNMGPTHMESGEVVGHARLLDKMQRKG